MVFQTAPTKQLHDRAPALAAELVRLKVDIIITSWQVSALAAKAATTTIPIVMSSSHLPVENGLIESYARPGGNVTGVTGSPGSDIAGKSLQLMKEVVPSITRMAILVSPWAKEHVMKKQQER